MSANERRYFLNYQQQAMDMVTDVGAPNLKLLMDLYHAQVMEGDLETRFRKNISHIAHMQVAGVPLRREPDEGEVNFRHLFSVIDSAGYTGAIGCEYRPRGATTEGLQWRTEAERALEGNME
jgi:hydroxypyruvate isomerase